MKPLKHFLTTIFFLLFLTSQSHQSSYNYSSPPQQNHKLLTAYTALQALKHTITSDPNNFTTNWSGPNVCAYTGVYCAPSPDDPKLDTVAGIDLNHAGITGYLPDELGLLTDLALFHLNSNKFFGTIPATFCGLHLLYELDLSNNQFSGNFPSVVLSLPSLKFLDIRFNQFCGDLPSGLFNSKLDAIFINDNRFEHSTDAVENVEKSSASVIVLANNQFKINGCKFFPRLARNGRNKKLNEIILMNVGLKGCLPDEIGLLKHVTVFDVSFNELVGPLPETIGNMRQLEQLNVASNKLSGEIPASVCSLPNLKNFTYSDNYFCGEPPACLKLPAKDDRENCIPMRKSQRSVEECKSFYSRPVYCGAYGCSAHPPPPLLMSPPPPPPPSPPPPSY